MAVSYSWSKGKNGWSFFSEVPTSFGSRPAVNYLGTWDTLQAGITVLGQKLGVLYFGLRVLPDKVVYEQDAVGYPYTPGGTAEAALLCYWQLGGDKQATILERDGHVWVSDYGITLRPTERLLGLMSVALREEYSKRNLELFDETLGSKSLRSCVHSRL